MENASHTTTHTERGYGNIRRLDHALKARGFNGVGSDARKFLKKVRSRKRRQFTGDELPTL